MERVHSTRLDYLPSLMDIVAIRLRALPRKSYLTLSVRNQCETRIPPIFQVAPEPSSRYIGHDLDKEFCDLCVEEGRVWESGSTALVAMLVEEHLIVGNLGDARGIIGRSVADPQKVPAMEEVGGMHFQSTIITETEAASGRK
jgi:hypothetical protein